MADGGCGGENPSTIRRSIGNATDGDTGEEPDNSEEPTFGDDRTMIATVAWRTRLAWTAAFLPLCATFAGRCFGDDGMMGCKLIRSMCRPRLLPSPRRALSSSWTRRKTKSSAISGSPGAPSGDHQRPVLERLDAGISDASSVC